MKIIDVDCGLSNHFITSRVSSNQHNDQLRVGLLPHLVDHCTSTVEVMGSNPVQA